MRVVDVDPSGEALAAWHDVVVSSLRHLRPADDVPPLAEVRAGALAGLPERDPSELVRLQLLLDGDDPVGALRLELPLRDNRHLVWAEGHVRPDARRRGAGTALLRAAERAARDAGRTLLSTDLDEPPGAPSPGRAFLQRAGWECALTEVRRELALPVPEDRLDALEAQAAERSAGYDVVAWADRCPDGLVAARAELGRVMSVDVPSGSLDWHEEAWDADRVRERERLLAEQERSLLTAAAQDRATGALVAYTELCVRPAAPALVEQWDTLVVGPHRGHRLGTRVKVAALRLLAAQHPGARRVVTSNADTNAWMIAVNEALGFVPDGVDTSWQRAVGGGAGP